MSEISKQYDAPQVEARWSRHWLERRIFAADPASPKPPYSMVIPPPNVTGVLTLGHVLNNTIQDILARRARMQGYETLWLPGTDHAGIATQVVVEKRIRKEEGLARRDLGREKFIARVWEWKEKHGRIIVEQLKRLGCSCDWSRERFTMDPEYSRKVAETFVDLYHKGLIYRGKRMVNWCPATQTALSDEEVIMKPQQGFLYYFKVELADEPGRFLSIATTRPETIPGDTAVAVNPKDPRYAALIGRRVVRPLPPELPRQDKLIPIIGDERVDVEFGAGALKVTPAHDQADFEIGQRHQLPVVDILTPEGRMNELAGRDLAGLDRFKAREKAAERLRSLGAMIKEEPYENNVGFSERADVPIEPRLSEQWFMRYPKAEQARRAVANGEIQFFPDRWRKVYDHWMSGLQDWCISRQLWWGHRIPVWHKDGEMRAQLDSPGPGWEQDPDVLDTWCSSWLWPFATMDDAAFKKFYPTSVLVTGPDIIFFWVARMIMAGLEYTGRIPFHHVYFTGIVRDKSGRKMSKSLGNSPDPLDLISKYSADALRFGVMRSAPLGQDILFDEQHVELGRNFCTKLWNACRFRQLQGGAIEGEIDPALLTRDDKWILLRLDAAIRQLDATFGEYRFNEVTQILYRFFWSEFCDWHLESAKVAFASSEAALKANKLATLDFILSNALRLLHPFLPFITEELWHGLQYSQEMPADQGAVSIAQAPWPKPFDADFHEYYRLSPEDDQFVSAKFDLVTQGRNLRREANLPAQKKVTFILKPTQRWPAYDLDVLRLLLNADKVETRPDFQPAKGTLSAPSTIGELFLPLAGLIDFAAERARLEKELAKIDAEIERLEQKMSNPAFREKVPSSVWQDHEKRLADWQSKRARTSAALAALG